MKESQLNLSMVAVCRQIRRLAMLNHISLDRSVHRDNENNQHLFSYIEYCGLDPLKYIKSYLANLQPFMLARSSSQDETDTLICVIDNAYRISLYITSDMTKGQEVIVSFHENVVRGLTKENNTKIDTIRFAKQIVPVFGERTGVKIKGSPREQIKVFIQRGMLLMPALVMAQECENNIFLVERNQLEQPIIDACNQYLRDLYTSNINLKTLDEVEIFSVLQQMSFTSYGNTIFSNISLLIDNLEIQKGFPSKQAADFALVTYINNLYLSYDQAKELIDIMSERYKVSPSRNIEIVLNRVIDEIMAIADKTVEQIMDSESTEINESVLEYHNQDSLISVIERMRRKIAEKDAWRTPEEYQQIIDDYRKEKRGKQTDN